MIIFNKIIFVFSIIAIADLAIALDASKFIDKMKKVVPNATKEIKNTENETVLIKNLVQSFDNLTVDQKNKLAHFRMEYQKKLENLMLQFETLPKEVQDLLKEEKRLRSSLSQKGQEELNNYIKNGQNSPIPENPL